MIDRLGLSFASCNSTRMKLLPRALLLTLLLCVSLQGVATATNMPAPIASVPSAVIVRFNDGFAESSAPTTAQQTLLAEDGAAAPFESLGEPGLFRVTVQSGFTANGVAAALERDPAVAYADADERIDLGDSVATYDAASVGGATTSDWALAAIHAQDAWKYGDGQGVVVAVLDTGVSATHPDLRGRVLPGWNFIANNSDTADDDGHGTFVAGLIAASNSAGPEGVAPHASILPIKILDNSGVGSTASFIAGINYAVDHGARIINISASGASDSAALDDALANAEAHSVVVVGSSGNDGTEATAYPAGVPTVLAVSATDQQNALARFSSYGPYVDIAAPGVDITSTWWSPQDGNGHAVASGSSASAPLVSGVAAIVAGVNPGASAASIREIITDSSRDISSPGLDAQTGYGLLDAFAATVVSDPPSSPASVSIDSISSGGSDHLMFSADGFQPGEQLNIWTVSSGTYKVIRGSAADASGSSTIDLGPIWEYPVGSLTAFAVGNDSSHAVSSEFSVTAQPATDPFEPVQPEASTQDRTYFPATGHTLAYGFKQFWESNGGLAAFGYPISEEFSEQDSATGQTYTVQYFERYRFEYHPEFSGTPWEVSLGLLGEQIAPQTYPTAPPPPDASIRYFSATQHTLSGAFRMYWETNGGIAKFGYPTSEPFEQGGTLVQYFERARFEFHPDLPSGSHVLLSRLGVQLARERGYLH